eukprot:15348412-Ditylum_brightwellii.AAC.1
MRIDLKLSTTVLEHFKDAYTNDKDQTMNILRTVIGRLCTVELLPVENQAFIKRAKAMSQFDSREMDLVDNFMRQAGLTDRMWDKVEASTMMFDSKVNFLTEGFVKLEKSVAHISDMMGAYNNPGWSDNIIVEINGSIFKGESDVHSWMEENLPETYLFGMFVKVYVALELILLGQTSIQSVMMERNMKLNLQAEESLILQTYENKLHTLFGRSVSKSSVMQMITSTKDSWLPGVTSFSQWETSNGLGGMQVVLKDQLGTVEQQIREFIRMLLCSHPKVQGVAISCLETSLGFLNMVSNFISNMYWNLSMSGFLAAITWQLVSKLVYQVFAGDLDEVRSFVRISHRNRDHLTLASCTVWAIFKSNKVM